MEILECWMKNYGKFSDYRITFHSGLNVVEGGNESGKSTVFSFIRAMLYGLQKNRSKSLDEYQLRQPWVDPDHFAGAMKVHFEDRIYRIERNFLKKDESLTVVCETEGREVEDPETFLRRLTGGLSETDFLNTFYIRQAQAQTEAQLGADLRNYLVNTEQTGSAQTDVASAIDRLRRQKRELEAARRRKLEELDGKLEENRRQTEYVRGEIGRLGKRLEEDAAAPEEEIFTRRSSAGGSTGSDEAGAAKEAEAMKEAGADKGAGAADETGGAGTSAAKKAAVKGAYSDAAEGYPDDEYPDDEHEGRLLRVLSVLFILAGVLSLACGLFAFSGILQIALYVLGAVFLAACLLTLRLPAGREGGSDGREVADREGADRDEAGPDGHGRERSLAKSHRRQDLFGEYEDADPEAEDEDDEQEERDAGGRSRRRLRRAERSVERYSRLNHLFGFRDDSVDPDLEAKKRRLDVQREKAMQEEEAQARRQTAAGVSRILNAEKADEERRAGKTDQSSAEGRTGQAAQQAAESRTGQAAQQAAEGRLREAGRTDALSRELREKQLILTQLQEAFSRLAEEKEKLRKDDEDIRALDLAIDRITKLSSRIYHETGEQFAARVSQILSRMTEGRYRSISMNEKMEVVINTPDRLLKMDQVSYGTMNQIYFALRIASGELLSGGAALPLLLDEPFAMYDDGRLKEALGFLAGYGRQIILFTCQGREKILAREI